ncbi:hypothetical protein BC835DRAFT_1011345 [Cytidiella melzeri]|nr:hypothetical protein BC835DRAFT_1011345 [Cytidiella melzeri]
MNSELQSNSSHVVTNSALPPPHFSTFKCENALQKAVRVHREVNLASAHAGCYYTSHGIGIFHRMAPLLGHPATYVPQIVNTAARQLGRWCGSYRNWPCSRPRMEVLMEPSVVQTWSAAGLDSQLLPTFDFIQRTSYSHIATLLSLSASRTSVVVTIILFPLKGFASLYRSSSGSVFVP